MKQSGKEFGNMDVMDKNDCVLPRGMLRFPTEHYHQPRIMGGEMFRNANQYIDVGHRPK